VLRPGDRFGRHRILGVLGEGGMGVVYDAHDEALDRRVALKAILPDRLGDPSALERFRREARAACAVSDPRVVALHGLEHQDGVTALVFEHVPGGSLRDRLARGPLRWREAVAIAIEVARGLAAIHAAGLVHRDVKPANILIDARGRPKIADLGLVRRVGPARQDSITKTGQLLGTFEYLAPEAQEKADVGPAADLYSLGAVIHHLVAGEPPFLGQGFALLKQHAFDAPPRLGDAAPRAPRELEELVLRLLSKEPARRGDSAESVARELEAILARRGRASRPALVAIVAIAAITTIAGAVAIGGGAFTARSDAPPPDPSPGAPAAPVATPATVAPASTLVSPRLAVTRELILETPVSRLSLTPDGRRLVVGGHGRPRTYVIDTDSFAMVGEPLPYESTLLDQSGECAFLGSRLEVRKLPTTSLLSGKAGAERGALWTVQIDPKIASMAAWFDSDGALVYVGLNGIAPDPVLVLDSATGEVVKTIAFDAGSLYRVAIEPRSRQLYVWQHEHEGERDHHWVRQLDESFVERRRFDDVQLAGSDRARGRVFLRDRRTSRLTILEPNGSTPREHRTSIDLSDGQVIADPERDILYAPVGAIGLRAVVGERTGEPLRLGHVISMLLDAPRRRLYAISFDERKQYHVYLINVR
jgi:hypothetical protein